MFVHPSQSTGRLRVLFLSRVHRLLGRYPRTEQRWHTAKGAKLACSPSLSDTYQDNGGRLNRYSGITFRPTPYYSCGRGLEMVTMYLWCERIKKACIAARMCVPSYWKTDQILAPHDSFTIFDSLWDKGADSYFLWQTSSFLQRVRLLAPFSGIHWIHHSDVINSKIQYTVSCKNQATYNVLDCRRGFATPPWASVPTLLFLQHLTSLSLHPSYRFSLLQYSRPTIPLPPVSTSLTELPLPFTILHFFDWYYTLGQ